MANPLQIPPRISGAGIQVSEVTRMRRLMRRPKHSFNIRCRPWEIAPICIAPVLPGETLKNLMLQARVITDPVRSQLVGWWTEHYFFYVRHRDIQKVLRTHGSELGSVTTENLTTMHLDPTMDLSVAGAGGGGNLVDDSAPQYLHRGTVPQVPWTMWSMAAVVLSYFRDIDETFAANGSTAFATFATGGLPIARCVPAQDNWMDSLQNNAEVTAATTDVILQAPVNTTPDPDVAEIRMSELDKARMQYEWLRQTELVEMTFEQFLETHGIRTPAQEDFIPELLRYAREWTYPANSADPTGGAVRTVVSWSPTLRADKDRFFREPGFVIGMSCTRPKVYLGNQPGAAAHMLAKAVDWLPAMLAHDSWASYRKFATGTGPLPVLTDAGGYWIDLKDLYLYGDQAINFDPTSVNDINKVALPTAAGLKRYPVLQDAKDLFVDATNDVLTRVRQDGVVQLMIAGRQSDQIRSTT